MADLDAALLALAVDDYSDEQTMKTTVPEIRHDSPLSSGGSPSHLNNGASSSSAPAHPTATPKKPTTTKAKTSTKKKVKRGKKDDSEEEGEAYVCHNPSSTLPRDSIGLLAAARSILHSARRTNLPR